MLTSDLRMGFTGQVGLFVEADFDFNALVIRGSFSCNNKVMMVLMKCAGVGARVWLVMAMIANCNDSDFGFVHLRVVQIF